jgi:para-aminobenzoate synthetase component 1
LLILGSTEPHPQRGRYSFVSADPMRWHTLADPSGPFAQAVATLRAWLESFSIEPIPGLPPFQGGIAGLFGYELGRTIERLPQARWDEFRVPILAVGGVADLDRLPTRAIRGGATTPRRPGLSPE